MDLTLDADDLLQMIIVLLPLLCGQDTEVNMTSLGPVLEAAFAAAGIQGLNGTAANSAQRVGSDGPSEHCDAALYKAANGRMQTRRM